MLYVPQVHRYFLGRDSSAFEHMFSMPSEGSAVSHKVEGCSDENPVQLFGESVERFRALLSVIYDLYVLMLSFYSAMSLIVAGGYELTYIS